MIFPSILQKKTTVKPPNHKQAFEKIETNHLHIFFQFVSMTNEAIINKYNMRGFSMYSRSGSTRKIFIQHYNQQTNQNSSSQTDPLERSVSFGRYRNTRSLFLTEHDAMQKTKPLWRQDDKTTRKSPKHPTPKNILKETQEIKNWKDLARVKGLLQAELMKRRSREELFEENMRMIDKIENTPPKVDPWNYVLPKKKKNYSSSNLQVIFQQNMQMIKKIQNTPPKVDAWNFRLPKKSPRRREMQRSKDRIFEQNMKMIEKVENAPPKVESWSYLPMKRNKRIIRERLERKQKLFQENMKMIEKVENTPPKVESWIDLKGLRRKVQRKKSRDSQQQPLNIQKIRAAIKEAEVRLQQAEQKQKHLQKQRERKYRTLPSKIQSPRRNGNNPQLRNFTARIQGVRCQVKCWNKANTNNKKPLGLMQIKKRQKDMAMNKLRPKFFIK